MSEESSTNEESRPHHVAPSDWFLQNLVLDGLELPVTLQMHGLLVYGTLVSGRDYFEGLASELTSDLSPEGVQAITNLLEPYIEFYQGREIEDSKEEADPPLPAFIHLRDAKFFNTAGRPIPGNRGVWWRGRISEVDGFMLGILKAKDEEDPDDDSGGD